MNCRQGSIYTHSLVLRSLRLLGSRTCQSGNVPSPLTRFATEHHVFVKHARTKLMGNRPKYMGSTSITQSCPASLLSSPPAHPDPTSGSNFSKRIYITSFT